MSIKKCKHDNVDFTSTEIVFKQIGVYQVIRDKFYMIGVCKDCGYTFNELITAGVLWER